ncbi:hypothetical protein BLNAU_16766 [Blattamonas nauphoetae]|uniref:Uncharacterized protein n=1 Tax=Blattamonas nauphoetae TaxID=2049346 RepID=A0ABQ9XAN4_9EUKA|nr:hypothetical protein BLNAU_16766 [Blattamonas nauphoetae]
MTAPDYSPFLKWNRNDPVTVDSVALVFSSLLEHASLVHQSSFDDRTFEALPKPRQYILPIIQRCCKESQSTILKLHPSQWTDKLLSTNALLQQFLHFEKDILRDILEILLAILRFGSVDSFPLIPRKFITDPQSIGDAMLDQVFIPLVPSLARISHNLPILPCDSYDIGIRPLMLSILEVSRLVTDPDDRSPKSLIHDINWTIRSRNHAGAKNKHGVRNSAIEVESIAVIVRNIFSTQGKQVELDIETELRRLPGCYSD